VGKSPPCINEIYDAALLGIRIFYVILPLACGILSMLGYMFYPSKGKRLVELKDKIFTL
jgi:Na+/melibiose symporter-like transporter